MPDTVACPPELRIIRGLGSLCMGATESLAPNKWGYKVAVPISLIVIGALYFFILLAPFTRCLIFYSNILFSADTIENKLHGATDDFQHLLIFA